MKRISNTPVCHWAAGFLASCLFFSSAHAQDTAAPPRPLEDTKGIVAVSLENDFFAGEDDGYTNGVRISYLAPENTTPRWLERTANQLPFFSRAGHKRWHMALGQSMFAPSDITRAAPDANDRPYAGYTYGSVGILSDTGRTLDNFQLTLGVVGSASGAEETQNFVHSLIDYQKAQGWEYQLHNEVGVELSYERKWKEFYQAAPGGWAFDVTPSLGATVGNVYTHASAGAIARFGQDLPKDYGPPLIRPNLSGSDFFVPSEAFGWYLFAGVEGRAVARNIFLDGNTFRDSPSVDKYPFVGGLQAGVALVFSETRVAYTHTLRTREFRGQNEPDSFGAVSVSWRF